MVFPVLISKKDFYVVEKLSKIFIDIFNLERSFPLEKVRFGQLESWDSMAHLNLIYEIENVFSIEIDPNDFVAMSSFEEICRIVEKYINAER